MTWNTNPKTPDRIPTADDLGPRPTFEWLDQGLLVINSKYQREINEKGHRKIRKIAKEFSWAKFQPLTVAGPDRLGDYSVIDGQHRLEAGRLVGLADVPCWIVPTADVAGQADAFIGVNQERVSVTKANRFWAEVARGDAVAIAVRDLCAEAGVQISRSGTGRQKPGFTTAVTAIEGALKMGRPHALRALKALAVGQDGIPNAFRGQTITALTRLVGLNADLIDDDRLARVLADMDLDHQIQNAQSTKRMVGGKTEDHLLTILIRAYNKNLSKNRLPVK